MLTRGTLLEWLGAVTGLATQRAATGRGGVCVRGLCQAVAGTDRRPRRMARGTSRARGSPGGGGATGGATADEA